MSASPHRALLNRGTASRRLLVLILVGALFASGLYWSSNNGLLQSIGLAPDVSAPALDTEARLAEREATLKSRPGYEHPANTWFSGVLAEVPFSQPGVYRKVPVGGRNKYTADLYLPMAYAQIAAVFPFVTVCMPDKNPGFLGLEGWAERNGAVLIVMNDVSNATYVENAEVQRDVLETAFKLLRLDPARGIAIGMSGGGRTSWDMIRAYPKSFAGIVQIGFFGGTDPQRPQSSIRTDLPPHIAHASIHGDTDFNARDCIQGEAQFIQERRPIRRFIFPGGHEWGPLEIRERALHWILRRG